MKARYIFWIGVISLVTPASAMSDVVLNKWKDLHHMVCITRELIARLEHHAPNPLLLSSPLRRTLSLLDHTKGLVRAERTVKYIIQHPVFANEEEEQALYRLNCRECSTLIDIALTEFTDACDIKILRERDIHDPFISLVMPEFLWLKNILLPRGCAETMIPDGVLSSYKIAVLLSLIRKHYFIRECSDVVCAGDVQIDLS